MIPVAIVVTQDILVRKKFFCLEIAYTSIATQNCSCRNRYHFFVKCPFDTTNPRYPELTTEYKLRAQIVLYKHLVGFLRDEYRKLKNIYPDRDMVFLYKGRAKVLRDAGIRNIVNIDRVIPSVHWLQQLYPFEKRSCGYHSRRERHCVISTLQVIERYAQDNEYSFVKNIKKRGIGKFPYVNERAQWVHVPTQYFLDRF